MKLWYSIIRSNEHNEVLNCDFIYTSRIKYYDQQWGVIIEDVSAAFCSHLFSQELLQPFSKH